MLTATLKKVLHTNNALLSLGFAVTEIEYRDSDGVPVCDSFVAKTGIPFLVHDITGPNLPW